MGIRSPSGRRHPLSTLDGSDCRTAASGPAGYRRARTTEPRYPTKEMEYYVRKHMRAWVVCGLAIGLAAAGCTKNTGNGNQDNGPSTAHQAIVIDTKGTAPTPAAPIPNAKPGGTIYWLADGAPEHLDPTQMYVSDSLTIDTLLYRHLTYYIEDPNGGSLQLVGDLATNAGESSNEGKTWTYH